MNDPTENIVNGVRVMMSRLAHILNVIFKGKLKPSHITLISLLGHIPAAWALWQGRTALACILIAVFGLMDALDGALAREQKSASKFGMFFDAVTDRIKEIILYSGLGVYAFRFEPRVAAWVVPALAGTSILVSFVKAKGEMAIAEYNNDRQTLNRTFSSGIARYEIRMSLLIIGLLSNYFASILNLIIALNLITASERFSEIAKQLNKEDSKNRSK